MRVTFPTSSTTRLLTALYLLVCLVSNGLAYNTTHGDGGQRYRRSTRQTPYTEDEKEAILDHHNKLRRDTTNAADMVKMVWDDDLATEAQRWADLCKFSHPTEARQIGRFTSIGQNLYVSTAEPSSAINPTQSWYDEVSDYTYSSNQCSAVCGHYTQVVWAKTEAVGCAIKWCDPISDWPGTAAGYLVVCEYGPPGNYIGQKPYQQGKACSACPDGFAFCDDGLCSKTDDNASSRPSPSVLVAIVTAFMVVIVGHAHSHSFRFLA